MANRRPTGLTTDYESEAEKHLQEKDDRTLAAMIRGMQDVERVQEWIETEAEREARQEVIGKLNRRKMELE
jgi:hypothetical protein